MLNRISLIRAGSILSLGKNYMNEAKTLAKEDLLCTWISIKSII